jgi:hypothetical protein
MPFERETNIQFALKGHITHINHEVGTYIEELAARPLRDGAKTKTD